MELSSRLGVILRRHRNRQNMNQVDVAAAADCARSFVSNVENGKVNMSIDTFVRLCEALEAKPWDVLKEAMGNAR